MTRIRTACPEDWDRCVQFANRVFTDSGKPTNFQTLIPKTYASQECFAKVAKFHYLAESVEGEIVGMVCALPQTHIIAGETVLVCFIGTVSVHPRARGEGHMKRLMNRAIEDMKATGTDLALLTGRRQRYEYFGFSPAGVRWTVRLLDSTVRHALSCVDAGRISFTDPDGDGRVLAKLHAKRPVRVERGEDDFEAICRTYQGKLKCIKRGNSMTGFLVTNAAGDEIRDLVCDEKDFDAVLKAWQQTGGYRELTVSLPDWERTRLRHMALYAEEMTFGTPLCAHILNPEKVLSAWLNLKAGYVPLEDGILALEACGRKFCVSVQSNRVSIRPHEGAALTFENEAAFGRFVGYPFDYEGRPQAPEHWFPLPFYSCAPDEF